ncbi:methyltransferase-like protein 27 [Glandiceps talaboti]
MAEGQQRREDFQAKLEVIYKPGVTTDHIKNLYDEWSHNYDEDLANNYNGAKHTAKALSKVMGDKHARILDCGCGTGFVGNELQALGYDNLDGVDMSTESLAIARDKGIYLTIMCAELGPEPLEGVQNDDYDAIVGCGIFVGTGHLKDSCLLEWTRIVKPGGYIVLTVNEEYTHILEGDTYRTLIANKTMELEDKHYIPDYFRDAGAYIYTIKVLF